MFTLVVNQLGSFPKTSMQSYFSSGIAYAGLRENAGLWQFLFQIRRLQLASRNGVNN